LTWRLVAFLNSPTRVTGRESWFDTGSSIAIFMPQMQLVWLLTWKPNCVAHRIGRCGRSCSRGNDEHTDLCEYLFYSDGIPKSHQCLMSTRNTGPPAAIGTATSRPSGFTRSCISAQRYSFRNLQRRSNKIHLLAHRAYGRSSYAIREIYTSFDFPASECSDSVLAVASSITLNFFSL
jgi:hypothetical protein